MWCEGGSGRKRGDGWWGVSGFGEKEIRNVNLSGRCELNQSWFQKWWNSVGVDVSDLRQSPIRLPIQAIVAGQTSVSRRDGEDGLAWPV